MAPVPEHEAVVLPIDDDREMSADEWVASLRRDEPLVVTVPAAELLAEAREGM